MWSLNPLHLCDILEKSSSGILYESNSTLIKSKYSYYHEELYLQPMIPTPYELLFPMWGTRNTRTIFSQKILEQEITLNISILVGR
jgi:hypothetical protein